MAREKNFVVFAWIILASFAMGLCLENSLKIKSLRVPEAIQEGNVESIILDCDYTVEELGGFVLKWYFHPENAKLQKHIYQWIHGKVPQAIGAFRNSINLKFSVSDNPIYKYRAMNILNPTRNMTGTYQCVVETFTEGPAKKSAKMIVYVPPKTLQFSQEKNEDGSVGVSCTANDVFPAPDLDIRVGENLLSDTMLNKTQEGDLLYDVRVEADLEPNDLTGDQTKVSCELTIPGAHYTIKQEGLVYQGVGRFHMGGATTMLPKSAASANLAASASRNDKHANSATILVPCLQLLMVLYCSYFVL